MTARKLAGHVTVGGQTYGPDDELPADVAKQIDNPKAWGKEDKPSAKSTSSK